MTTPDGRRVRGDATRRLVARQAANDATVTGLESVTIGTLAAETGVSKSGILTVFGNREALLIGAVNEARAIYREEVIDPARTAPRGIERLHALIGTWVSYVERQVFAGGCFLASTAAEFAGQTGPVADRVRELKREWLGYLAHQFAVAGSAAPEDDAFHFDALLIAGLNNYLLLSEPVYLTRAVTAATALLTSKI